MFHLSSRHQLRRVNAGTLQDGVSTRPLLPNQDVGGPVGMDYLVPETKEGSISSFGMLIRMLKEWREAILVLGT